MKINAQPEQFAQTAAIALEMANAQLEQGWEDVDADKYASVQSRLAMVSKLVKDAERAVGKM